MTALRTWTHPWIEWSPQPQRTHISPRSVRLTSSLQIFDFNADFLITFKQHKSTIWSSNTFPYTQLTLLDLSCLRLQMYQYIISPRKLIQHFHPFVTESVLNSFILVYIVDCDTSNFEFVNHAVICSWNQPVLSNADKVSCSEKQR